MAIPHTPSKWGPGLTNLECVREQRNQHAGGRMVEQPDVEVPISSLLWRAEHVFADRVGASCESGCAETEFTYRDPA